MRCRWAIINNMRKYIISIEEQDNYPFDGPNPAFQLVVVRVAHSARQGLSFALLRRKLHALLALSSPCLLAPLRVREIRGSALEIDYEYVPEALLKSQRVADNGFLAAVREKLQELGAAMAEQGIKAELKAENMGVAEGGEVRVFLGLNFELLEEGERKGLAQEYQVAIERMLEGCFGFRNSLRAHSDTQKSQYSQRLDKRLTEMEGKLNRLRLRSGHSSHDSSSESCRKSQRERQPNIVMQAVASRDSNNSSFSAGTSYSLIAHPQSRPKVHKSSFGDYSTSSYRLNEESVREDSLQKRVSHALQKTQEAFKIYEKYSRRKRRL